MSKAKKFLGDVKNAEPANFIEVADDFFIVGAAAVELVAGGFKIHDCVPRPDGQKVCLILSGFGVAFAGLAFLMAIFGFIRACCQYHHGKKRDLSESRMWKLLKAILTFLALLFLLFATLAKDGRLG